MIIWLASYPKSGNTMLRSMLSAYLFSNDGIFNFELLYNIKQFPNDSFLKKLGIKDGDINSIIKNSIKAQELFNNKNSIGFVKTHNMLFNFEKKYPFTNFDHSLGAIYIVRDPRNLVLSYARHLDRPIEEIVKFVTLGKGNKNDLMGNWAENYSSWKAFEKHNKYLLIKYEDLIENPKKNLVKIIEFIFSLTNRKLILNMNKIKNVIETTTLDNLKNLEKNNNFQESVKDNAGKKINFFDQGGQRNWSKSLNKNLIDQIEKSFKREMVELGYI
ncbi:sulfotransferase domain-containing protein [Candidatus Pelagibacter bacterium nBUS_29]|uniref:sulfotransferase domain-containing protein n=1 Tax=Candidatus Pelagibacter bacterium nBUS_29 TaxID=3374190 RepID=UPI003EBE2780